MLHRFALPSIALVLTASPLLGADLPSRRAPPVFVPPPTPAFTWTGGYVGFNAGYAFDNYNSANTVGNDALSNTFIAVGAAPPTGVTRANGFTGGGQIGYNYQLGGFGVPGLGATGGGLVVGVEADAAYTDLSRTGSVVGFAGTTTTFHTRTDFVGTVRGRVGLAFDRLLVFGTGGFAYGEVQNNSIGALPPIGVTYNGSLDRLKTGYSYGGGVEYALPSASLFSFIPSSAVTVKGEFIHYDLGSGAYVLNGNPALGLGGSSFTTSVRTSGNLVRAGLNFKFGSPAAPVVARY